LQLERGQVSDVGLPVGLDQFEHGIECSRSGSGWCRQRQTCAKGSATSGHASGLDEEAASRR
jgi:hypothetical protein